MLSISALKSYLQTHRKASLIELEATLQEDHTTIQYLLHHLIKKGCVKECRLTPKCGKQCTQCPSYQTLTYEYVALDPQ